MRPKFLMNIIKVVFGKLQGKNKSGKKHRQKFKIEKLRSSLEKIGLLSGQVVIMHSSLSNLGRVEGGAAAIVDLIEEILGEEGTLIVPISPSNELMVTFLERHREVNLDVMPSRMGVISQVVKKRGDAEVSFHPTHPVAAIGKLACEITATHHLGNTPFSSFSPFYKLAQHNGWILLLGVDLNSMTNIHVYEDMLQDKLPYMFYRERVYETKVVLKGEAKNVRTLACSPEMSKLRDVERMRKYLLRKKIMRTRKMGEAEISLINVRRMNLELMKLLSKGITPYGKIKLDKLCQTRIKDEINKLRKI